MTHYWLVRANLKCVHQCTTLSLDYLLHTGIPVYEYHRRVSYSLGLSRVGEIAESEFGNVDLVVENLVVE